jgi:hypothetical protein
MTAWSVIAQIFLNAPRKALRQLRRISMEYHQHPTHSMADLQALLQSEGFLVSFPMVTAPMLDEVID